MPLCPRLASSVTRSSALPSSSQLHRSRLRRFITSCNGGQLLAPPVRRPQCPSLLVAEGGHLHPPPLRIRLQPSSAMEPGIGRPPRLSRPLSNLAVSGRASGPEMGDPEMEGTALWEMVNVASIAPHTQTHLRSAHEPPELGPCVPPRCPTAGMAVVPLVPLAWYLGAWLALPSPSRSFLRTISLCYVIQLAQRPPKFSGIHFTAVKVADAPVLHAKVTIEPVPPADMKTGFYSPYFIVPKKGGVLRSILDLRILNRALHRLPFKMLMQKRNFGCIRPQNWFAVIDLKDAYFHVPILLCHRSFLRFAFEGRAYQYKVLPGSYTAEAASYETT